MSSKKLVLVGLVLAGALGAGVAQAHERADVQWSVTVGTPLYGQPVYSQPVYAPAPVYVEPAPVYRHHGYREPTRWDVDGDGIPNRYDRVYNPSWDRDGDGIPDRHERHDRWHDRAEWNR
jgi:hypothetical protein